MKKTPRSLVWILPLLGLLLGGVYSASEHAAPVKAGVPERSDVTASIEAPATSLPPAKLEAPVAAPDVAPVIREAQARRGSFTFDGDLGIFRGETWRCKFHRGLVRFVTAEACLEYQLAGVSVGGRELLDGRAPVASRISDDTFGWDRGAVEELYRHDPQGMEQSFRISTRPTVEGDLVVRGRVRTNLEAPEGARGSTLTFRRDGDDALAISHAVVIDARGRRLPLEMDFQGGELAMRVPSAWLRDAEFPVVVDPTFGSLIQPDIVASGGLEENLDSYRVTAIDVAYNPTLKEYFVVWNERFSAGDVTIGGNGEPGDFDVWSCRVSAKSGQLVQAANNPNPIDADPEQTGDCRVAYNSALDRYLTVYRYFQNSGASWAPDKIRGRLSKGAGGNDPGPDGNDDLNKGFLVNSDQVDGIPSLQPVVAAAAGRWLVAWTHTYTMIGNSSSGVYARFVTGADTFDGGTWPVQLGKQDAQGWTLSAIAQPSVAFNATSGTFLVAWQVTDNSTWLADIQAATATTTYPAVLGPVTDVSAIDGVGGATPDVTANAVDDEFVVAWREDTQPAGFGGPAPDHDVMARRLNGSGVAVAAPAVLIGGTGADGAPKIDYNPVAKAYLLAWKRETYTEEDFRGWPTWVVTDEDVLVATFTAPQLAPLETETPIAVASGELEYQPAVRCRTDAGQALVAWQHQTSEMQVTRETPEAIRFFMGPGAPPASPAAPASGSLAQSGDPGAVAEAPGYADLDGVITMRAAVTDPNSGETVALQVEIKAYNGSSFDGSGLITGSFVPNSGGVSEATSPLLQPGPYCWRARAINSLGLASSWVEFNPPAGADFWSGAPPSGGGGGGGGNGGKACAAGGAASASLLLAAAFGIAILTGGRPLLSGGRP